MDQRADGGIGGDAGRQQQDAEQRLVHHPGAGDAGHQPDEGADREIEVVDRQDEHLRDGGEGDRHRVFQHQVEAAIAHGAVVEDEDGDQHSRQRDRRQGPAQHARIAIERDLGARGLAGPRRSRLPSPRKVCNRLAPSPPAPLAGEGYEGLANAVSLAVVGRGGARLRARTLEADDWRRTRAASPPFPTFPRKGGRGFVRAPSRPTRLICDLLPRGRRPAAPSPRSGQRARCRRRSGRRASHRRGRSCSAPRSRWCTR